MTGNTETDRFMSEAFEARVASGDAAGSPETAGVGPDPPNGMAVGELDALHVYLRELGRHPRISADRARRCCRAMHDAEDAAEPEGARNGRARDAFEANRDEMVEGHLGLVVRVARQYERFGTPLEDLIQEGNLGLLAAVRGFDPDRGVPFPMYAIGWIRQAICRAISTKSRTIRIPLEVLGLRRRAATVMSDLEQEAHNRSCRTGHYEEPTVEDCAHEIGIPTDHLRATMRRVPNVDSLDAPTGPGKGPLVSLLADPRQRNPMHSAAVTERRSFLETAVAALPERLRYVMRRHYGLRDDQAASFSEIGHELHVSGERVRQLHNRGLKLLRGNPRLHAATS